MSGSTMPSTGRPGPVGPPADHPDPTAARATRRPGAADRAGRRQLALVVLLSLLGSGLALYAATRPWVVEWTSRPAPLPPLRAARTGGDLLPWLPALAVVGLAGTGAVLATRGAGRRLVGVLLGLIGLGLLGGGLDGLRNASAGPAWPALAAVGGLLAVVAAGLIVSLGQRWPAMGARYDRRGRAGSAGRSPADPAGSGRVDPARSAAAWDALDRGEDPTLD